MGDPNQETPMTNVGGISVFGATYPAHIWAAFMKAALANMPPTDFIPPNEKLWPRAEQIDEQGRGFHSYFYTSPTTTSVPVVAPVTTPTAPHQVPTTTSPFAPPPTVPRTPPPPPATTPPTSPKTGP
jgi:membrane peptidoglycan carboxypeptidase